jgi:hypothetical protein
LYIVFVLMGGEEGTHGLAGVLREVVRRDEAPSHTCVEARPPVVSRVHDGVLEAARVLEVEVELAVLGAVGGDGAGTGVGLELIEAVSDDLFGCVSSGVLTVKAVRRLGR